MRRPVRVIRHDAPMHPLGSTTPLATGHRLSREWARLRTQPAALRRAATWQLVDGDVLDLGQILDAVGYRRTRTADAERCLRRLVLLAAEDELAGRVVIERVLPGLLAVVARRRRMYRGPDAFDELLGAAWLTIRTFNAQRRPACLAAAIISDADYRAFRSPLRRRDASTVPIAAVDAERPPLDPNPSAELDRVFRLALAAGVPESDIELMRQLIETPTAIELADRLQVTPRTIRNRRARITDRLREVALAA